MLLAAISKSGNPKYTIQAAIFISEHTKKTSMSFQHVEQTFLSLDFDLDKEPQKQRARIPKHQAKMSSHTSVDTPSNKIGRGKGKPKKFSSKKARSHRGPAACFACGSTAHMVTNCTDTAKKEAWLAKRAERLNKKASPSTLQNGSQKQTEQCCMARIIYCDGVDVSDDDQLYLSDE